MTTGPTEDATALATAIAKGETDAHALLSAAIAKSGCWNPKINALCHQDEDQARQLIDAGLASGPFRGVPFLLKDIGCETPDFPVSNGSRLAAPVRFKRHSTLYSRLRGAGLVPFARTTTPEGGIGPVTEAALYGGPTRNPWDLSRTPGGSSGGAAAAVAAGLVPAAQGSDGGGSLRMPASNCGLVALKASRARIPDGPYSGEGWAGMSIDGVLTRTVRDQALFLDVLAGPDLGAPYFPPPMADSFLSASRRDPGKLRIGLCDTTFDGAAISPECRAGVLAAGQLLEGLGHSVEHSCPTHADHRQMMRAWTHIVACGTEAWVRSAEQLGGNAARDQLEPVAQSACRLAATLSGADYLDAVDRIHAYGRDMATFFDGGPDILLSATLAEPPARIGRFAHARPEFEDFMDYRLGPDGVYTYSPFVAAFNASGQPAMSLPLFQTEAGIPIGIHFAAPMGADAVLISLAAQLEAAAPWPTEPATFPGRSGEGA
ncbi:MAG: amidase family protein [Pseudomonadota bacterium]